MDAIETGSWRARLRWRTRGALTWPLFALLTLADVALMALDPIAGESTDAVGAFLLAGFVNLAMVAGAAPLLARVARRRGGATTPLAIVSDRVAAGLLVGVTLAIAIAGLVHHPSVAASGRENLAMRRSVTRYVNAQAPAYRAGLHHARVDRLDDHLYRTCIPGPHPHAELCLLVATDQSPPGVSVDTDHQPSDTF